MIIGRSYEAATIKSAIDSEKAELGVLYGRRRVGKSALLKSMLQKGDLYFEAVKGYTQKQQIQHFLTQLSKQQNGSFNFSEANSWAMAFDQLTPFIEKKRRYVVFDEIPWMASEKPQLIAIIKYYWDNYWKNNPKLTLVLCGSIAQFMVKHIVHSEALHNRKTFETKLEPLKASDAKGFFKGKKSTYEIAQYLMVFGGIPKYLEQIDIKKSFSINVNHLCLEKSSFFMNEFETIFKEQFKVSKVYEQIVIELNKGSLSKSDLSSRLKVQNGGGFKEYLDNLERADFIKSFASVTRMGAEQVRTKKYYLWDEWIRFYLTFMKPNAKLIALNETKFVFPQIVEKKLPTYFGLSFERFCIKNIVKLLDVLRIPIEELNDYGPYFRQKQRGTQQEGVQIDLLILRKRKIITLVECKYVDGSIGVSIVQEVERKVKLLPFKDHTIEKVLVYSGELNSSVEEQDYFNQTVSIEELF